MTVLMAWISRKITTKEDAKKIAQNNYAPVLKEDAFIEMVGELGWRRDEN